MSMTKDNFEELMSSGRKIAIMRFYKECECAKEEKAEGDKLVIVEEEKYDDWTSDGWGAPSFQDRMDQQAQDELVDAFDNVDSTVYCNDCFGLGKIMFPFIFRKVRYTSDNRNSKSAELLSNNQTDFYIKNGNTVFFLPSQLNQLKYNDYICTLKHDSDNNPLNPYIVDEVFKIVNLTENPENNFFYISAVTEKITFSKLEGVDLYEYCLAIQS